MQTQALRSPCGSCNNHGKKDIFPDICLLGCKPVNEFLIHLGDRPHIPTDLTPLPKVRNGGYSKKVCTPEQFQEVKAHLTKLKKKYHTLEIIRQICGVSVTSLNRVLRIPTGKIDLNNWQKIMETK